MVRTSKEKVLTIYSSVSTVGSPPDLGGLVDLYVVHYQCISVEHPHFSVALCVSQQVEQKLGTLLRPSPLRAS